MEIDETTCSASRTTLGRSQTEWLAFTEGPLSLVAISSSNGIRCHNSGDLLKSSGGQFWTGRTVLPWDGDSER